MPDQAKQEPERGRHAESPTQIPKKGWKDILLRTKEQLDEDNLSIVAAGVAFYAFVATVPALAVVIAVYALVADRSTISSHLEILGRVFPGEVMPLLKEQITRISSDNSAAGISAFVGFLFAVYSSANAVKGMITGLNIAYGEKEKRGFIKLNLIALALTVVAIFGLLIAIGLLAVLPVVLNYVGMGERSAIFLSLVRWPLVVCLFLIGLAATYRYAPSRDSPQWKWLSYGAGLASFLWLVGSAGFSLYVSKFGSYDKTYGSLGAVVIFLLWLYLSAYVVLLGAELNSEMERQTVEDTTEGKPEKIGSRHAYAADTVGASRD